MLEVWEDLRANLEDWPDSSFYASKSYIGLRRGNKTVCYFHFQKNALKIAILRGTKTEDGERSGNFFDLDDYKELATGKDWTYKSGCTRHGYEITLKGLRDVSYVLQLIEQKYRLL